MGEHEVRRCETARAKAPALTPAYRLRLSLTKSLTCTREGLLTAVKIGEGKRGGRASEQRPPGASREAQDTRAEVRRAVFLHQDGLVLSSVLSGLHRVGILEPSLESERSVSDLLPEIRRNGFGYLRVALRTLASVGWIEPDLPMDPRTTCLRWTEDGRAVASVMDRYLAVGRYLEAFSEPDPEAWSRRWDSATVGLFAGLVRQAGKGWQIVGQLPDDLHAVVDSHLDGAVLVPAMLRLHGIGAVGPTGLVRNFEDAWTRHAIGLLRHVGWLCEDSDLWTDAGSVARASSTHYGLAASYLPLLARLPSLFRGAETVSSSLDSSGPEWHVNRSLNVTASGAAHGRYFADADEIIRELFDCQPVADQPRFVADMGCGDGSWLVRIYAAVRERTRRGRQLDSHPLVMVGLDCNEAALERARAVLDQHQVPSLLVRADISDPAGVAELLAARGLKMEDGLHIRSFIDHDRNYFGAENRELPGSATSTGAYVGRSGIPLAADQVERDLVAHLDRWAPFVQRHGLVILEAHTVPPSVSKQHLGALHTIAFDAYHGFSHQYPVEHARFLSACRAAKLEPDPVCARRYPTSRPFVAVSLNRLVLADAPLALPGSRCRADERGTWSPDPGADTADGEGLHRLLYSGGDLRRPRPWCLAPTGWIVGRALSVIESRLEVAKAGDVIRILDYGTGTGLAAIELLKACAERNLESRLERAGASVELHLADLPSSWFARGYQLLSGSGWTRFHSLRNVDGGFRALTDLTGPQRFDVILVSMVFHLIPPDALKRVAAEIATVLKPGGVLLWNSPDLGPPGAHSTLFHGPNRALRALWTSLVEDPHSSQADGVVHRAAERVAARLGPAERAAAERRASKRILKTPTAASTVSAALDRYLHGAVETRTFEMLDDEVMDALLVPSNVGEYLSEIEESGEREEIAWRLMSGEVLPAFKAGPAGTGLGVNVQWTFGEAGSPRQAAAKS